MSQNHEAIRFWMENAITGSLVYQRALRNGLTKDEFMALGTDDSRRYLTTIKQFGVDPAVLTRHALTALTLLFSQPKNEESMITAFMNILWEILGDPSSGTPPKIYKKAASCIYIALIHALDPEADE